jgi:hypothetical protein
MEPARGKICGCVRKYRPKMPTHIIYAHSEAQSQDLSKWSVAVIGVQVISLGYNPVSRKRTRNKRLYKQRCISLLLSAKFNVFWALYYWKILAVSKYLRLQLK